MAIIRDDWGGTGKMVNHAIHSGVPSMAIMYDDWDGDTGNKCRPWPSYATNVETRRGKW